MCSGRNRTVWFLGKRRFDEQEKFCHEMKMRLGSKREYSCHIWKDDSVGRTTCCTNMRTQVEILSDYIKKQALLFTHLQSQCCRGWGQRNEGDLMAVSLAPDSVRDLVSRGHGAKQ